MLDYALASNGKYGRVNVNAKETIKFDRANVNRVGDYKNGVETGKKRVDEKYLTMKEAEGCFASRYEGIGLPTRW